MAISTGAKRALGEALSWLALCASAVVLFFYFDEIKTSIQIALDLPTAPAQSAAMELGSSPSKRTRRKTSSGGTVELRAGSYGQFRARADINGSDTKVLVDTGASSVALTDEDARDAGIYPDPSDYTVRIQTANGIGKAAPVIIDAITIGDITVHNVRALVNEPGTLHVTLLGMTFLNRLRGIDISSGTMTLKQ